MKKTGDNEKNQGNFFDVFDTFHVFDYIRFAFIYKFTLVFWNTVCILFA